MVTSRLDGKMALLEIFMKKMRHALMPKFEFDRKAELKEIRDLSGLIIVETHIHKNGFVTLGRNSDSPVEDAYTIFVRTPGFWADFAYTDPSLVVRAWERTKRDLEFGAYGPWKNT